MPAELTIAEKLIGQLNFNTELNPEVALFLNALKQAKGNISDHVDLGKWRADVAEMVRQVNASYTGREDNVKVSDTWIPADKQVPALRLRVYRPEEVNTPMPLFYWMHGGGMMGGSPEQDDIQMRQIAASLQVLVVAVDYRLAPEYPFPFPLDDCYRGLLYCTAHASQLGIDSERIAVGGASAGAGLASSLTLLVREKGGPAILHQSLSYPMLDDRDFSGKAAAVADHGVWDRSLNVFAWKAYLSKYPDRETLPVYAVPARARDLSRLPPAFIALGSEDLFRNEDMAYALRLMQAGVSTELHFFQGTVHGFDWHFPHSAHTRALLEKRMLALKLALFPVL